MGLCTYCGIRKHTPNRVSNVRIRLFGAIVVSSLKMYEMPKPERVVAFYLFIEYVRYISEQPWRR